NQYEYGYNNPVKYIDPTGHENCISLDDDSCGVDATPPANTNYDRQYDLTAWLAREMVINVQSPEMQEVIAYMNPDIDSYPIWAGGLNEYIMGSVSAGYSAFLSLNHENAKWNIKIPIQEELGDAVILCGTKSCGWFDYSTPGNIHFGFMAAAAGIPRGVSQGEIGR